MAKQELTISSILGGIGTSYYASTPDQYLSGVAIDPNAGIRSRTTGAIVPVKYAKFSGANVNAAPGWIITNPKNNNLYTYLNNGRFISYNNGLASETLIGTPTSGAGNGAAYYNNYIYLFTPTDVSRYGPLNNSPSLSNTVWTGATLGSQTALTNTTYPSGFPNHAAHEHFGSLYFCDVSNGQGIINRITTKKGTSEGDTNDNSAYNVLDLPFGYLPVDIESFGEDLIIAAIQSTDNVTNQGPSALFLWNTYDPAPYRKIPVLDPYITALLNVNGTIHVFAGTGGGAMRKYTYSGGYSLSQPITRPGLTPPTANLVDASGNRVVWASGSGIYAQGYSDSLLPQEAINCIAQPSTNSATVTALKYAQQDTFLTPQLVFGWNNANTTYGLDKFSSGGGGGATFTYWFNVGKPFTLKRIRFPIATGFTISSGVSIGVSASFDDALQLNDLSTPTPIADITPANFPGSPTAVTVSFPNEARGSSYFYITLTFYGTDDCAIGLPIIATIDTYDEYTAK